MGIPYRILCYELSDLDVYSFFWVEEILQDMKDLWNSIEEIQHKKDENFTKRENVLSTSDN